MSCQEYENRAVLDLSGDLSPREAADLQAHLAGCADCRRFLAEMKASRSIVQDWKKAIPEGEEEYLSQIRRNVMMGTRFSHRRFFILQSVGDLFRQPVYRLAAGVVSIALIAAGIWSISDRPAGIKGLAVLPSTDLMVPTTLLLPSKPMEAAEEQPAISASITPSIRSSDTSARTGVIRIHREMSKIPVTQVSDNSLRQSKAFIGRIELQTADPNIRIIWLVPR